jgi:hypothetical protein
VKLLRRICEASRTTRGFQTDRDLGHVVVGLFSLPFQLPLASVSKLLPGFSHLLELLAMSGRGGSRHLSAFGGMQKILVDLVQAEAPTDLLPNGTAGFLVPCRYEAWCPPVTARAYCSNSGSSSLGGAGS